MPTQFFKVTRAPEAGETTAQEIKHALIDVRDDTEWDVKEFIQLGSKFPGNPAPGGSGQLQKKE